jgi:3-dehydroquinate synthase
MGPNNNLVLTGFMGTGKTTVGNRLAERLGREFVDTDALIEDRHGPIAKIFAERGESAFREIERDLAIELGQRSGLVIATGGRMLLDPEVFRALSRNGRIFCLMAMPDEIYNRVTHDKDRPDRPLLKVDDPQERIIELLADRGPQYERFPQVVTDQIAPDDIAGELVDLWETQSRYAIESPSGGYGFTVGAGILPFVRQLASAPNSIVLLTDDVILDIYGPAIGDCDLTIKLPSGRIEKTLDTVQMVYDRLLEAGIDRSATLVSLGTSIVGDIAGFVAATYLRGIDLVHCPTDLIAMVDTSIGGKAGLDLPQGRNLVGIFKQPKAVIADVATLQTLPVRHFKSGMAEVIKHGLLASSDLLDNIQKSSWDSGAALLPGVLADLRLLVAEAIQVKIAIVHEDPFEQSGRRTVLNLGHTFAYALEYVTQGELNHGEAVGIGLVAAARLSVLKGHAAAGLAERVEFFVTHVGLEPMIPTGLDPLAIIDAMYRDKKRRGSQLRFVLLRDVGDPFLAEDVTNDELEAVLRGMIR